MALLSNVISIALMGRCSVLSLIRGIKIPRYDI